MSPKDWNSGLIHQSTGKFFTVPYPLYFYNDLILLLLTFKIKSETVIPSDLSLLNEGERFQVNCPFAPFRLYFFNLVYHSGESRGCILSI